MRLTGGIATVTEVGAEAAIFGILVSVVLYRELSLPGLWLSFKRATVDACKVLLIISVAGLFVWIIANMGFARVLSGWIAGLTTNPTTVLFLVAISLLVLGTILEPVVILVVLVPMIIPMAQDVGINLVQLGLVSVLATLIGLITPPVGFLIYLSSVQAEAPAHKVIVELLPFIAALVLLLLALILFPGLTLWLPTALMG